MMRAWLAWSLLSRIRRNAENRTEPTTAIDIGDVNGSCLIAFKKKYESRGRQAMMYLVVVSMYDTRESVGKAADRLEINTRCEQSWWTNRVCLLSLCEVPPSPSMVFNGTSTAKHMTFVVTQKPYQMYSYLSCPFPRRIPQA
jgi:hypothetical protein